MDQDETPTDIQKLIRLKRFECPPEGAVDDFLEEFQDRQRKQALTGSSTKLLFERVTTYMSSFGKQKWLYGAGAAYACVMLFFLVKPSVTPLGQPPGGGEVNPINAPGSSIISEPAYDPTKNRVRPKKAEVPEVIVL